MLFCITRADPGANYFSEKINVKISLASHLFADLKYHFLKF
jgi:hypothetical protein